MALIWMVYLILSLCIMRYCDSFAFRGFLNSLPNPSFDREIIRIGVDYGPNLIGIASTNMLGIVTPIATISNQANQSTLSLRIISYAKQRQAKEIIIGLPLDKKGIMSYRTTHFNGQLCLRFSSVLAAVAAQVEPSLNVLLFDESYTTKEAQRRLSSKKTKGKSFFYDPDSLLYQSLQ
jgi:RNase H-fold protein (predicted Holliday junction resolvase)